jgi:hypothetical protein
MDRTSFFTLFEYLESLLLCDLSRQLPLNTKPLEKGDKRASMKIQSTPSIIAMPKLTCYFH